MPGAVPRTSTFALTNATLPYTLRLAKLGAKEAIVTDPALRSAANVINGKIVYKAVADAFDLPYTPAEKALA
jgi:alanine dehydrogenase